MSCSIEIGVPIILIHPPYLFLVGVAEYEECYPSKFGFGDEVIHNNAHLCHDTFLVGRSCVVFLLTMMKD